MHILSLALGGCLRPEPVSYGITEDTGGHITYILGEMAALAERADVTMAEIVTRYFVAPELGQVHSQSEQWINDKLVVRRIDSGNRRYLAKEALDADRAAFTEAFLADLRSRKRLPDLIHAHFADAADIARTVKRALGIPYIYTAHSLGMDKRETMAASDDNLDKRIAEEDAAIAGASAVIGSSRDECERQIASYPSARIDRIYRVTPGIRQHEARNINVTMARDLIAPFLQDADKPIILAIARPVRKKNLGALVEAFGTDQWLREHANLVLLAGQRDDLKGGEAEHAGVLSDIANRIDRHDLYGKVAFPKRHSRDVADGLYQLAAQSGGVFVNPAKIEPYGLTVVEAAVHGLPVVATRIGGPTDIVGALGHGELVDPYDIQSISTGIRTLLRDPSRWDEWSRNGRERVRSMTWERYASEFMDLANTIVKPAEPKPRTGKPRYLIVSDLDNTLTGCVASARKFGKFLRDNPDFAFVAATGRSLPEARRIVREWALPTPDAWITSVGTEIYTKGGDGLRGDLSYSQSISKDWRPGAVTEALKHVSGLLPQAAYEQREFKRSYHASKADHAGEVRGRLAAAHQKARVVFSHDTLLDVIPASAGKGAALTHIADVFGVSHDRVFAAGDSGNDEDMLTICANAILVANYSHELAHMTGRSNVYVADQPNAAGVIEGIIAHQGRRTALRSAA